MNNWDVTVECMQWLMGLGFMLQGSAQSRSTMAPWHVAAGRALFFMAICAALTGLMEKYTMLKPALHQRESHLINFTGLAILLFGVFVDMAVGLARYAWNITSFNFLHFHVLYSNSIDPAFLHFFNFYFVIVFLFAGNGLCNFIFLTIFWTFVGYKLTLVEMICFHTKTNKLVLCGPLYWFL